MSFKNLNLINPIIRAVTETGYSKPTEIQHSAIPHILMRRDILGCAPSGSGKTAAFAMPVLQLLKKNTTEHKEIRTLILTSTSDRVLQIEEDIKVYSKYLPLSLLSIIDGASTGSQLAALRKRVDILISSPEKLLDLVSQRHIDLSKIEILILDETDKMLDLGFVSDLKAILALTPKKKQTLFFSAVMENHIRKFAEGILKNPVEITVSPKQSIDQANEQPVYFGEKKTDLTNDTIQDLSILSTPKQNKTFQYIN
ncbi:DEAD/DEAH box helicase [Chryseobacterium sp. JUb7]|uniref:DEAD/DEAH box helicase n=1 Tax=Chryseobacterium sp. JUb7 TaxID=2940599 RepID=UPI002168DAE7|nr:DEAD/DEAH box helicase [Chryseobacterium sp. JUb7]MCS3529336.1 superfamily II DNA/RNA helicase [Chryseobacterium sp. JUb7]